MNARARLLISTFAVLATSTVAWAQPPSSIAPPTTPAPVAMAAPAIATIEWAPAVAPQAAAAPKVVKPSVATTVIQTPRAVVVPDIDDQQTPPPPPPPPVPGTVITPRVTASAPVALAPKILAPRPLKGQLANIKVEFILTDQVGTKPAVKKTVAMTVADGESSRIRTNVEVYQKTGRRTAPLSVDVNPTIDNGKIRLDFSLEYSLLDDSVSENLPGGSTQISERLSAVLESGVSMIVSQSADPLTDRKMTVEVKATIIK